MLQLLQAVELDLTVEQGGHLMTLQGADGEFVVTFPTLRSLLHFGREMWPQRHLKPKGIRVSVRWRGLRWLLFR